MTLYHGDVDSFPAWWGRDASTPHGCQFSDLDPGYCLKHSCYISEEIDPDRVDLVPADEDELAAVMQLFFDTATDHEAKGRIREEAIARIKAMRGTPASRPPEDRMAAIDTPLPPEHR